LPDVIEQQVRIQADINAAMQIRIKTVLWNRSRNRGAEIENCGSGSFIFTTDLKKSFKKKNKSKGNLISRYLIKLSGAGVGAGVGATIRICRSAEPKEIFLAQLH
jgi:hypothetical protein